MKLLLLTALCLSCAGVGLYTAREACLNHSLAAANHALARANRDLRLALDVFDAELLERELELEALAFEAPATGPPAPELEPELVEGLQ